MTREDLEGQALVEISNAVSAFKRECYGRGPARAKTYAVDDLLLVVLKGGLTDVEETLLRGGETDLVRTMRVRFHEITRHRMIDIVERISGQRVLDYMSQILLDTITSVEIFMLEPRARRAIG